VVIVAIAFSRFLGSFAGSSKKHLRILETFSPSNLFWISSCSALVSLKFRYELRMSFSVDAFKITLLVLTITRSNFMGIEISNFSDEISDAFSDRLSIPDTQLNDRDYP